MAVLHGDTAYDTQKLAARVWIVIRPGGLTRYHYWLRRAGMMGVYGGLVFKIVLKPGCFEP